MDTSGRRKHKRPRKDDESPGNNKRQKVTPTTSKNNNSAGSSKAGCSAQNRLTKIRTQQTSDISNISSGNSSFESSMNHSKVAENVLKFPLSDRENKLFNFSHGHKKTSAQGRLRGHKDIHSSTPVQNSSKSFENKKTSLGEPKCGSVSDPLKIHSLIECGATPPASNGCKLYTTVGDTFKTPSPSQRLKVHSTLDDEFKTSSVSHKLKLPSSPDGDCKTPLLSQRLKLHSLLGNEIKTLKTNKVLKLQSPCQKFQIHSSTDEKLKTPSPSQRLYSSPDSDLKTLNHDSAYKTLSQLNEQLTPKTSFGGKVPNRLNIQSVSPPPFKSVSDRLKIHVTTSDTSNENVFSPDISKSDGFVTSMNKTLPCRFTVTSEEFKTPLEDSFESFSRLKEQSTPLKTSSTPSFKRVESPNSNFGGKSKKLKTLSRSERLKEHSTASELPLPPAENVPTLKPNTSSSLFSSFGFMSDKLKSLSSFFKSASDSEPKPAWSGVTNVSNCHQNFFNNNSMSSKPTGSFGFISENSAWSVFSEKRCDLLKKENETTVVAVDEDYDMDWSPETQEEVVADIRIVRDKVSAHNQTSFYDSAPGNFPKTVDEASGLDNKRNLYIVVDTNVFINKLNVLLNILKIEFEDGTFPVVYVPWMVVQELDYFKDGYNVSEKHVSSSVLKNKAMKAIRFINDNLISKKTNFMCQPALDATQNQLKILSPDDSILSCCFQVGKQSQVMLLSGDINLCNKAMINSFEVLKPDDALRTLSKIKKLKDKVDMIEKVSEYMSRLCSFIIYSEWKQTGEQEDAARFRRMPWSFPDCIRYMKENYVRVFKPFLQKQSQKIIDDIYNIVILNQDLADESKFIELILSLLIFLKTGLGKYELNINKTIDDIKKLKNMQ